MENQPLDSLLLSPPISMLLDLRGKKALVTGIANNRSIAWGIAQQLVAAGCRAGRHLPAG
jgi:hypothetical protein